MLDTCDLVSNYTIPAFASPPFLRPEQTRITWQVSPPPIGEIDRRASSRDSAGAFGLILRVPYFIAHFHIRYHQNQRRS